MPWIPRVFSALAMLFKVKSGIVLGFFHADIQGY
jgi:hypothetical protein